MARLDYLELPVRDVAALKRFYGEAFGWHATDYGPSYSALDAGTSELGLNGSEEGASAQLLPLIRVDDLEGTLARVTAAGGVVTLPVFAYPGGRRFHFRDPQGHELGAYVVEAEAAG